MSFEELRLLLNNSTNNCFDNLNNYLHAIENKDTIRNGVYPCKAFIQNLFSENDKQNSNIKYLIEGLTLSKSNKLSFIDCFIRGQYIDRIIYKTFIKVHIEGNEFFLLGKGKWTECIYSLSENAIPFNEFPKAWSKIEDLNKFIRKKIKNNDKVLENRVKDIFIEKNVIFQ
ncbi:MAG: hypothetical protein ACK4GL_10680 [Flavobacteriales bacterium]